MGAAAIWPVLPLHPPLACPLRSITGIPCPLCGMTRACIAAVHGHLGASLAFNPGGILVVLLATHGTDPAPVAHAGACAGVVDDRRGSACSGSGTSASIPRSTNSCCASCDSDECSPYRDPSRTIVLTSSSRGVVVSAMALANQLSLSSGEQPVSRASSTHRPRPFQDLARRAPRVWFRRRQARVQLSSRTHVAVVAIGSRSSLYNGIRTSSTC